MTYNEIIQKAGKRVKKHVYYIINGVTTNVNDENVERVKFDTQTPLIGTSINGCEITLKEQISGNIYVQIEAKYGTETKTETFGPFTLKEEPTYDANKKTYLHKCYDNMLKSMVDYEAITMTYPCTVLQFFIQLISEIGYTNNILSLPNGSRTIKSDIYSNIGFTYRDVIDDIAVANGVLFYIDGNEIKIATLGGNAITIDDDILKNKNIEFSEHYGPINSIVLSRSGESDSVYIKDDPSIAQYGLHEFKIIDNQLMNENDRSDYLPALKTQLNGIEYDIYDTELTGYGKLKPLQTINFETSNNTYSSYLFNNEITLTTGYKQAIYNDPPEQTETDYKSADTTDKRVNQAYIIVRKQEAEIESLASRVVDVSDTKTGQGSIQLENAYKGQLYQLSIKGYISLLFPQSETVYGYPLVPSDDLVPSNTLTPSSPVPYENEIHYPSSSLYGKSNILLIDDKEYELDFDFLNYMSETICDEFIYDNGNCYIIRRVGIDSLGNKYALDNEVIEPRQSIMLEVDKDSIISLKSFSNAILSATYLLDNEYTQNFATTVEVQSEIKQTADSITEQVVKNDEVVAKLNLAIEEGQGVVNITGNQVTIDSDHFKLNANGDIEATNAVITGGSLELKDPDSNATIIEINRYYNSNNNFWYGYLYCSQYDGTETEIKPAKIMLAGSSGIDYVFLDGTTGEIDATGTITSQNGVCQGSRKEIKKNFEKFNNALDIINNVDIYKYHLKGQDNSEKKHIGFVIGDKYKYNEAITTQNNDCVDLYSFVSVCCQAIKEQQKQIEELTQRIEKLERESDK